MIRDFVELAESARERDLEAALLNDIERFMLALGEGFGFAGRQRSLQVGGEEFVLDLLFYHHPTRRFVVVDLKVGPFRAEFAGKMNLYVNAVNELIATTPTGRRLGSSFAPTATRPSRSSRCRASRRRSRSPATRSASTESR